MNPGTRLGPYQILEPLGAGGMGQVYLAQDTRLGRKVAIKVLPAEFADSAERLARFEQEARAAAALNHPHIAAVFDVGHEDGVHFMVQELLQGETLRARIDKGRLPLLEALSLSREIAEALGAAHGAGITHRDLKPENVFVSDDGHAKVLDFGLAKLAEVAPAPGGSPTMSPTVLGTVAGQIMGTAGYMAPEQVQGRDVDHRADVFAFGCLLYELATGRQPFRGQNMIETLNRITNVEPASLATIDGALPAELARILDKCLAKSPAARYQSARDLAVDLRGLSGAVETGRAVPLSAVGSGPMSSRGVPAAVVAALVVVALAAGSLVTWMVGGPGGPAPRLRRGSQFVDPGLLRQANWPAIALSPDGERIAYIVVADGNVTALADEGLELWVRSLDQLEGVQLADGARSVDFSDDGNWIAFRDTDNRLRKVPVTGGAQQTLVEGVNTLRGLSWGPDGRIVYAPHGGDQGLFSVSAAGGEARRLTTPEAGTSHTWPAHVPGGQGIVFTERVGTASPSLAYLDLETLEQSPLRDNAGTGRVLPTGHMVWMTDGALYAATFDSARRALVGAAVPVAEQVLSLSNGAAVYSIASDGTLAYLRGNIDVAAGNELGWADAEAPIVTGNTFISPALSPDGNRLAYAVADGAGSAIWTLDLGGQVPTRLTFDEGRAGDPFWSADGREIYYVHLPEGATGPRSLRVAADGSSPPIPVGGAEGVGVAAMAPSGDFLIFSAYNAETRFDLLVLPLRDGATAEPLAASAATEAWPAVSPDSRWVAFASNELGRWSVFVRAVQGTGAVRQIPETAEAGHPRWSADGRALYYRTNRGVMAVPVNVQGDALTFGAPTPVALGLGGAWAGRQIDGGWRRDYDLAPDGRVLAVRDRVDQDPAFVGHAVIVYNWFDEVTRLVAEGQ